MDTYKAMQKVLEYYEAEVDQDYNPSGTNVVEINTEDGYSFYAIQYDYNNNLLDYYYNEDALYEKVIDLIRDGDSIYNVDIDAIEWEELYQEVAEAELSEKNEEIRTEVLALLKPIAKTFLEDKIFTEEYAKLVDPTDPESEFVTEQQNDYVNLLLKELKFDTRC